MLAAKAMLASKMQRDDNKLKGTRVSVGQHPYNEHTNRQLWLKPQALDYVDSSM